MSPNPTLHPQLKPYGAFTLKLGERPYVAVPLEVFLELTAGRDAKAEGLPPGSLPAEAFLAEAIGHDFRASRLEAGLTQAQLAARMGISQTRVSQAESGAERVSGAFVKRWLAACGLPPDWRPSFG